MKKESFALVRLTILAGAMILASSVPAAAATGGDSVFARVDDIVITRDEFERQVYEAARQTFYHGRPPSSVEFIEFREGVAEQMINRHLLIREAKRRNLEPDHAHIDAKIAGYETRYGNTERWQSEGPKMMAELRARFEEDSLIDALEADVRSVAPPEDATLRDYYDANPELFTEPASNRVSVILLGVAPSATVAMWRAAREEAARIRKRLGEGESFDELARMHSSDITAEAGGDMGYLHEGMLSVNAEQAIAKLEMGGVSDPVQVLEGMAIFKLTDQQPSSLRSFDEVKERAEELWLREKGEKEWDMLVAELRSVSNVEVDTDYLAALPGSAN